VTRARFALALAILSLPGLSPAAAQPYAYVTNQASGTVSVIDTQTDKVASTFPAGDEPRGIAASADGARLYVGHRTGLLVERDLYQDEDSARASIGPAKAVLTGRDSRTLAVVLADTDVVALVDMPTLRVTKTIHLGREAAHAAFSPDGQWVYASARDGDSVAVVDVARGTVVDTIGVGGTPGGISFLPDGTRAYAAVPATREIAVIDVARRAVVARVPSAARVDDVAVHPDGHHVFASGAGESKVRVLDAGSNRFVADIDVGAGPSAMAFTADGSKLYVACSRSNDVSVIDTSSYKRIGSIAVGRQPSAIVIRNRPNLPRDGG